MEELKKKIEATLVHVKRELAGLRGGRAMPELIEDIPVEYYGSSVPLKQVAAITIPEAKTLAVRPWDKETIKSIAAALEKADLGAMPSVHGDTIHIALPSLTAERRIQLMKLLGKVLEEGRIALRRERDTIIETLKRQQRSGELSEDEFYREKEKVEEAIKEGNDAIDTLRKDKEAELENV